MCELVTLVDAQSVLIVWLNQCNENSPLIMSFMAILILHFILLGLIQVSGLAWKGNVRISLTSFVLGG